jgi:hypothetical protein
VLLIMTAKDVIQVDVCYSYHVRSDCCMILPICFIVFSSTTLAVLSLANNAVKRSKCFKSEDN